ncbi:Protein of unknown function [Gryllus bimaculatus]|nr:Protein of unknown function [Gryllus bimaculatus]
MMMPSVLAALRSRFILLEASGSDASLVAIACRPRPRPRSPPPPPPPGDAFGVVTSTSGPCRLAMPALMPLICRYFKIGGLTPLLEGSLLSGIHRKLQLNAYIAAERRTGAPRFAVSRGALNAGEPPIAVASALTKAAKAVAALKGCRVPNVKRASQTTMSEHANTRTWSAGGRDALAGSDAKEAAGEGESTELPCECVLVRAPDGPSERRRGAGTALGPRAAGRGVRGAGEGRAASYCKPCPVPPPFAAAPNPMLLTSTAPRLGCAARARLRPSAASSRAAFYDRRSRAIRPRRKFSREGIVRAACWRRGGSGCAGAEGGAAGGRGEGRGPLSAPPRAVVWRRGVLAQRRPCWGARGVAGRASQLQVLREQPGHHTKDTHANR